MTNKYCFLTRAEIKNYNVLIDIRTFYDRPTNYLVKQDDKVRNVST